MIKPGRITWLLDAIFRSGLQQMFLYEEGKLKLKSSVSLTYAHTWPPAGVALTLTLAS